MLNHSSPSLWLLSLSFITMPRSQQFSLGNFIKGRYEHLFLTQVWRMHSINKTVYGEIPTMFYCLSHAWWKAVLKEHKFVSGLMNIFTFVISKDFQIPIFLSFAQLNPNGYNTYICKLIVQLLKLSIQMLNTVAFF